MNADKTNYLQLAEELYLPRNLENGTEINETIGDYLQILNNGLDGKAETSKEIVVVGAGVAGMLSAILLADYGHKVTILEANKNRVGGRVKTFGQDQKKSPFKSHQYAEAGAMRFPSKHPLLMAYFDKYKLEKQRFFNVDVKDPNARDLETVNNTFLRTNSFQERKRDYANDPKNTNRGFYPKGAEDQSETAGALLDKALDSARNYYSYLGADGKTRYDYEDRDKWINGWAKLIKDFDQYSLGGYLREVAKLSDAEISLIGTLENLTARMSLSFMHSFLGRSDINPNNKYYELKGGSFHLIEVLHEIIKSHENITLKKNHRMTHIDYRDGSDLSVDLLRHPNHADKAKRNISIRAIDEEGAENHPAILGDNAIITIPFSSLRFVRVDPDFSFGKRRAIIELHYDAATKVLLEFDKRWWEFTHDEWLVELDILLAEGKINQDEFKAYTKELNEPFDKGGRPALHAFGGGSMTDSPNRAMYYPSHPVEDGSGNLQPGGVILASYTWSDDARRWDSMDDKERYDFALRGLRYIHGDKILPFFSGKVRGEWKADIGNKTRGAATQSWARNPYAFGEAAVFQPYQFTKLHPHIPTPEGPVFFAGEHTSLKHAWVEGSLESAIRVAKEVKDKTDQG